MMTLKNKIVEFVKTKNRKLETMTEQEQLDFAKDLELYEIAGRELDSGDIDDGLWAMAQAKGNGNTNGKYIELRVQILKTERIYELELQKKIKEGIAKEKAIEQAGLQAKHALEELTKLEAERKELRKKEIKNELIKLLLLILVIGSFFVWMFLAS